MTLGPKRRPLIFQLVNLIVKHIGDYHDENNHNAMQVLIKNLIKGRRLGP